MENALEIRDLVKTYPRFKLDKVNISLPEGYVMGFIGENGAGKSTTIKAVLGLIRKEGGSVKVLGTEIQNVLNDVGVVLCDASYPGNLNMKDLDFICSHEFQNWDPAAFANYVQMFSLDNTQKISTLSTGMKMKVSLAVALSHNARLLILDEPTNGLDPVFRDELLDVLLEFMQKENHSIFFSSHIVSDLEKISDYIVMIHDGRILFSETKEELLEKYKVIDLGEKDLASVDRKKLIGLKKSQFGARAMVLASDFDGTRYSLEKPTIEEIMLYSIKEEEGK